MQKRHTLHGAARKTQAREQSISSAPPGESGTRIRGAHYSGGLEDNIQASIDSAMRELGALEMPFRASAPPLTTAPVQQMPRGMPPLPFKAPHPSNMPPLPMAAPPSPPPTADKPPRELDLRAGRASARLGTGWGLVALLLGLACIGAALWLQVR